MRWAISNKVLKDVLKARLWLVIIIIGIFITCTCSQALSLNQRHRRCAMYPGIVREMSGNFTVWRVVSLICTHVVLTKFLNSGSDLFVFSALTLLSDNRMASFCKHKKPRHGYSLYQKEQLWSCDVECRRWKHCSVVMDVLRFSSVCLHTTTAGTLRSTMRTRLIVHTSICARPFARFRANRSWYVSFAAADAAVGVMLWSDFFTSFR